MLQTLTTMGSVLLSAGMAGIICSELARDRLALRAALRGTANLSVAPLPSRTHRIASPRSAQFIRIAPVASPQRVAA